MSEAPATIDGPLQTADGVPFLESLRISLRRSLIKRIGRHDVLGKEVTNFESVVSEACLRPRSAPCSHEDQPSSQL